MRNLSGGGPANPCWPYQPAEARTAAGSRYPRALRPCPGVLHAGGGGFAPCEASLRRVAGVSNPRVVQFPPIGGAAAAVCGDVAAKSSTILVKNAEDGLVVVKWSAFWVHQCLLWRVVRTRTCEYAC